NGTILSALMCKGYFVTGTYCHCTHKKKDPKCSQRENIREEDLEKQMVELLKDFTIMPEFKDLALEIIKDNHEEETDFRQKLYEVQQKESRTIEKRLDSLLTMRMDNEISKDVFDAKNAQLNHGLVMLDAKLKNTRNRADEWRDLTIRAFEFACAAKNVFDKGTFDDKKTVLSTIGQNFFLKDGKLSVDLISWLVPIQKNYLELEKKFLGLELDGTLTNAEKEESLSAIKSIWIGIVVDVRTKILQFDGYLYIPDLEKAS
ncbi:MAG: hypothetical protein AABY26_04685, partial [Nanoarchaeota archaeon]